MYHLAMYVKSVSRASSEATTAFGYIQYLHYSWSPPNTRKSLELACWIDKMAAW